MQQSQHVSRTVVTNSAAAAPCVVWCCCCVAGGGQDHCQACRGDKAGSSNARFVTVRRLLFQKSTDAAVALSTISAQPQPATAAATAVASTISTLCCTHQWLNQLQGCVVTPPQSTAYHHQGTGGPRRCVVLSRHHFDRQCTADAVSTFIGEPSTWQHQALRQCHSSC